MLERIRKSLRDHEQLTLLQNTLDASKQSCLMLTNPDAVILSKENGELTLKLRDLHKSYFKLNEKALSTEKKKNSNLQVREAEKQTKQLLAKQKEIQLFKNTLRFTKIEQTGRKKI